MVAPLIKGAISKQHPIKWVLEGCSTLSHPRCASLGLMHDNNVFTNVQCSNLLTMPGDRPLLATDIHIDVPYKQAIYIYIYKHVRQVADAKICIYTYIYNIYILSHIVYAFQLYPIFSDRNRYVVHQSRVPFCTHAFPGDDWSPSRHACLQSKNSLEKHC